ncbi:MAG TPA: vitamin B12-dependent ribonucleotide reductase [Actinomycetes bacterium]|nr:vitamin B12-dependent ribonucleotide reductase [Actinomycetes bacterium]
MGGSTQSQDSGRSRGLTIERISTTPGVHPYDEVTWERRDVVQSNWKTGETIFEQKGVEFPDFWSVNASTIVTTKYFRGAVGTPVREWSLKQLIDRVVLTYTKAGKDHGYFATDEDAEIFEHELTWALLHQVFAYNSPVWFNVGTSSPQQVSACQPYDALVSTPAGLISIGQLVDDDAVGTKVYDAHGLTRIVATKFNGTKDVLRLRTKAGYTLDVTADHLVWRGGESIDAGDFVEAGNLEVGDRLLEIDPDVGGVDRRLVVITGIEQLGPMPVYDIQTESGEYLSGNLRVHNCFILSVDDTMDSILNWYREEGLIFKGGSGAGLNLSRIRSSKELLSSGGTASGPVSFMRGADASAGTIKSGGATRRAAKMVVLDIDHPDIGEFVETKAREENKIRALRDAGFDMDLGGADITSVQYQNANNSVRVTDEFMRAVEGGGSFGLKARQSGDVLETIDARDLWAKIATAAWECADPGVQYDDTINDWHTNPETGRITASNPCSEYMSLDNSSCNLASINLLKFLRDDNTFDSERFQKVVELVFTSMDISICFADFPTPAITETTRAYRQLGIGYANLGALLMATGLAYDSEGGRALSAAITSLMTGAAYKRSAELAGIVGPYDGFGRNAAAHQRVMRKHAAANDSVRTVTDVDKQVHGAATQAWGACLSIGGQNGWRNAQASLLAPTGTIGFMMDCDTTGVEPDFSLVKFKKLVGGGSMQIVNQTIPRALRKLGYAGETIEAIVEHIAAHGHVIDAPGLRPEHYEIFDCAVGDRAITPMGHVRMMAAVQPFLSGAISKTVNMPETTTVDEVQDVYFQGWKLGLKALAIYRDNCKVGQPLSTEKKDSAQATVEPQKVVEYRPTRKRLPKKRPAQMTSFAVGGAEGYMTASSYPDDGLGEIFLKMSKQGSTLAGMMDAFSIAISIGLQYGVPLETFVSKFVNMRFEPAGLTDDPDVRMAQSIMDYVFRRLALDYLDFDTRAAYGVYSAEERARQLETGSYEAAPADNGLDEDLETLAQSAPVTKAPAVRPAVVSPAPTEVHSSAELVEAITGHASDAPMCFTCGTKMRPAGSCYVCEGCGSTSGCS